MNLTTAPKRLHVYEVKPEYCYKVFPGQRPDEKVIYCIRMHWIIHLKILTQLLIALAIPVVIYFAVLAYDSRLFEQPSWQVFWLLLHFYALYILFHYFVKWMDNFLDLIVVTTDRIVDINQNRIFNRRIVSANLAQIQDVSGEVPGFLGTFLRYGKLRIMTASEEQMHFEMPYVRHCETIANQILNIRNEYLRSHNISLGKLSPDQN